MKKTFFLFTLAFQCIAFQIYGDVVVGIHGFLSNWRAMKFVENALRCSGYEVRLWEYPSRKKFIEEHACELVCRLQKIACESPERPIHFVTHSIGALVLRSALNSPNCPMEAKIGRAVLFAPPNQGSCLARRFRDNVVIRFALGDASGWQITNYDPDQISCAFGEFPSSMLVLVIAGTKGNKIWFREPNDGLLTIEETRLNTPFYFECFPLTHGDLLTQPISLCCMKNFILGNGS